MNQLKFGDDDKTNLDNTQEITDRLHEMLDFDGLLIHQASNHILKEHFLCALND